MYIIESGQVTIYLGKEKKVLALLSAGDFFGEMAVILEGLRTAAAVASSPTTLLGFFRPDLFSLMDTHPKIGNKILFRLAQMISERLRISSIENKELKSKLNRLEQEMKQNNEGQ
jgi:CRP-like cAMP-binding protein